MRQASMSHRSHPPPHDLPHRAWLLGGFLLLAGCTYAVPMGRMTTFALQVQSCGKWDSSGTHTPGQYFVGHTSHPPDDTISYFVFDLTPVRGMTLTDAHLAIPGTADWKVTVPTPAGDPPLAFKVGITPLPGGLTLDQVTAGHADPSVYQHVHAEDDLGFGWFQSGNDTHAVGAFTYDTARLQAAVDAGGPYALFAVQRFGEQIGTDEYFYGGGVCGPGIVLRITTY
jgi:hypothetical protein